MDTLETYLAQLPETSSWGSSPLLRDVAYERIKDAVRQGVLLPGQVLSETRLSKLLGISRTPVREALQSLAQEGLIQIIPGRAVTVAAPSMQDSLSIIHIRSILEPEVVRLATEALAESALETLWQVLVEMETAAQRGDRTAWSKVDTRFHELLSTVCPNQILGELSIQMRNRVSYIAIDTQTSRDRLIACTAEHRAIVERMAANDAVGAGEATSEHIHRLWESTFRRFNQS